MKYFFGFLASVVLIVVVIILVVRGFTGGGAKQPALSLVDYANTETTVQITVEGPVRADELHQGYQITVGRNGNTLELLKGYEGVVTETRSFGNNRDSYGVFLRAIDLLGYTKGNDDPTKADSRGYCAAGKLYTFKVIQNEVTHKYWTTSCGKGNFKGDREKIVTLFTRQIPDFSQATRSLEL